MQHENKHENLRLQHGKELTKDKIEIVNEQISIGEATGLGYKDIISSIAEQGIKLSVANYYRYRDKLLQLNEERLRNMPNEYGSEYIKRINTFKQIEKYLWNIANDGEETRDKLTALKQLTDLQMNIQFFYNSSPIVNGMMDAIRDATTRKALVLGTST